MEYYSDGINIFPHLEISEYVDENFGIKCLVCDKEEYLSEFVKLGLDIVQEERSFMLKKLADSNLKPMIETFAFYHKHCFHENVEKYDPIPCNIFHKKPRPNKNIFCSICSSKIDKINNGFLNFSPKFQTLINLLCLECAKKESKIYPIIEYNYFLTGWMLLCDSFFLTTDQHLISLKLYERFQNVTVQKVTIIQSRDKNYFKQFDQLVMVRFYDDKELRNN